MSRRTRAHLESGGVGPRFLALAPTFYPPNGYLDHNCLTDAWGPMCRPAGTSEEVSAFFDECAGISGIVGVKVMIEYGVGDFYDWPIHLPEMRRHIMSAAAARGLPIFADSIRRRAHPVAPEIKPRVLAHSGLRDRNPPAELTERIKRGE